MKPSDYLKIKEKITQLLYKKSRIMIAIDGRAAAGKTTLAANLEKDFSCNLIHMDDFYLPLHLRDADWKNSPGKNINFQILIRILNHIKNGSEYSFCPYSCALSAYQEAVLHKPKALTIVEGSYSCSEEIKKYYDFSIFLDISFEQQKERILKRNGEDGFARFSNLWIPLEEKYFKEQHIREASDFVL